MNEKKKKGSIGDFLRTLIMLIALGVFCYSGYMLFTFYRAYKQGSDEYDNLEASYSVVQESETGLQMDDLENDAVMEAVEEQLEAMAVSSVMPQWNPGTDPSGILARAASDWESAEDVSEQNTNALPLQKGKIISREGVIGENGVLFSERTDLADTPTASVSEFETVPEAPAEESVLSAEVSSGGTSSVLEGETSSSRETVSISEEETSSSGETVSISEEETSPSGFGSILASQGQQTGEEQNSNSAQIPMSDGSAGSEKTTGQSLELESDMNIASVASAVTTGILDTNRMVPVWEDGRVVWLPILQNPVDFADLISINPDICGWLKIRALDISYPVVQGEDNDFYLHRTFEKTDNFAGCIFMDAANQEDFSDQNTVLYGHNMKNGSMFGKLNWLREKKTYEKSKYFWVFSRDLIRQYRIISGMVVNKSGEFYMNVYTEKEYEDHLINAMKNSELDNDGVTVCTSDRIVTLSTCTGDDATRFVVLGKLQQEYVSADRAEVMRQRFLDGPPEPETETEMLTENGDIWYSGLTWEEMSEQLPVIVVG